MMGKSDMMHKKLVVIGGGSAGMAAAIAAEKSGIPADEILILERDERLGGVMNQCIHAGFGMKRFGSEMTGPQYADLFVKEVEERKIGTLTNCMALSLTKEREITLVSPKTGYCTVKADAVILAMGCRERPRGALSIFGTRPSGVFTAGMVQKYMNVDGYLPGKRVVILGSGDIGLVMAHALSENGATVVRICEIMPYSAGLERNRMKCEDLGIEISFCQTVSEIKGKERLEGVVVTKVDENRKPIVGSEELIACDTLLISCGLIPENELTRGAMIALDNLTGGAIVDENRMTDAEGIFACGNVLHVHDIVDFVSEEAEIAGIGAARCIKGLLSSKGDSARLESLNNIKYVVPQRLKSTESGNRIYFRVTKRMEKALILLKSNGEIIFSEERSNLTPSVMQYLTLDGKTCLRIIGNKGAMLSAEEK